MSCECPRKKIGEWRVTVHDPSCTHGAGLVGDEWSTRESHEDARAAVDEALALDGNTLIERAKKSEGP